MPSSYAGSVVSKTDVTKAQGDGIVVSVQPPAPKRTKKISPQDAINEFWENFYSTTPGKATNILPQNIYAQKAVGTAAKGVTRGQNAVASYEEAAAICKAKVEKIVRECQRVNQKYRDPHFDIEFDLKWGVRDCLRTLQADGNEDRWGNFDPGSVKRVGDIFEKPEFFIKGATANDVRQGRDGDCWFMAALCTVSNKPDLIEKVCVARDEKIGVYGFVFYRDGEWRSEVIDDKLYLTKPDYDESWIERNLFEDRQRINSEDEYKRIYQTGSGALYFAQCEDPNETWLPLMEKAYAKAHGDYAAIEGGFTGEGIEDLTGGVTTEIFSTDILDKESFWKEELLKVNKDFLFGCAASAFMGRGYRKGIYECHAYSIMKAVEMDGQRLLLLRNPWGEGEWTGPWSDGSKEWTPEWMTKLDHRFGDDGAFWMSYEDLLKKYSTFDRTRLFDDTWKVTQRWTSLEVDWTVDYHSTKFSFTLDKAAPVVLVLSQLDDRYFCGLEGQYNFELNFRVHKAGEDEYIVRSHGNYCMRRSVTAELELPAGEYHVLMKVKAEKNSSTAPIEQMIRSNAKDRRDKLLKVGMAFDLAHAKGIDKEEQKREKKAEKKKQKEKERKEVRDRLMKEKKRRKHVENKEKRRTRAQKAKRKAKRDAKAKKRKVKEEAERVKREEAEKVEKEKADAEKSEKEKSDPEKTKTEEAEKMETEKADAEKSEKEKSDPEKSKTEEAEKAEQKTSDMEVKPESTDEKRPEEVKKESTSDEPKSKPQEVKPEGVSKESQPDITIELSPSPSPLAQNPAPPSSSKPIEKDKAIIPVSVPVPVSVPLHPRFDDPSASSSDSDSEIDSIISSISEGTIDEELALLKLSPAPPEPLSPPPLDNESEDEYQKDPWNAVCVVGLRVYSKGTGTMVQVVKGRKVGRRFGRGEEGSGSDGEDEEEEMKEGKGKEGEKGKEGKEEVEKSHALDVDDSAADAMKGTVLETRVEGEGEGRGVEVDRGVKTGVGAGEVESGEGAVVDVEADKVGGDKVGEEKVEEEGKKIEKSKDGDGEENKDGERRSEDSGSVVVV